MSRAKKSILRIPPSAQTPEIEITSPIIRIDRQQQTEEAGFSTNTSWSLSLSDTKAVPSWIDVNPRSGEAGNVTLTITILSENQTFEPRKAYIHISADTASGTITVIQNGDVPSISIDPGLKHVGSGKGTFNAILASNGTWSTGQLPDWISVTPESGEDGSDITVEYLENISLSERRWEIVFWNEGQSASLNLTQSGAVPQLSISPDAVQHIPYSGGTIQVNVSSNTEWMASSDKDWAAVGMTGGKGNATVPITVSANTSTSADEATVTFSASGAATLSLTVCRAGADEYLEISPSKTRYVASGGEDIPVTVTSNTGWRASSDQPWARVLTPSGNNNGSTIITVEKNTGKNVRHATVTFTGGDTTVILDIEQQVSQLPGFDEDIL